jgi:hypothetical protein
MPYGTLAATLLGLGLLTYPPSAAAEAGSFHLVLSDGTRQLKDERDRVAENVARSFRKMGIDVTWSFDPSDPGLPASNVVNVIILPRSSEDWQLSPGVLAAVRRDADSKAIVVVFYREVERVLNVRSPFAAQPIQGWRAPGRQILNGVTTVVIHEIVHYFLPGRPHDPEGVFMARIEGNPLARSRLELSAETRRALVTRLLREDCER